MFAKLGHCFQKNNKRSVYLGTQSTRLCFVRGHFADFPEKVCYIGTFQDKLLNNAKNKVLEQKAQEILNAHAKKLTIRSSTGSIFLFRPPPCYQTPTIKCKRVVYLPEITRVPCQVPTDL